jgi:hypothetical protein
MVLDSNPEGAFVEADGVAIGMTPVKWQVASTGQPRTLTFKLIGYRQQVVEAVPTPGLRLRPTLERVPTHRAHTASHSSSKVHVNPVDDIKSER